jgi:hypothetical protein
MAKKKFDPKAKAKRQKVILVVGGVLLLGLLAFQVPRTMKLMNSQGQSASSSPSTTTSSTPGSTPLAPPSLDGSSSAAPGVPSAGSAASTSADGISDPSNPLSPNAGQLVSFSRFKSKDPFKQQIATGCQANTAGSCSSGTPTSSTASKPASKNGTKVLATVPGSAGASARPTTGIISINGVDSSVSVGASFPAGAPVFILVSLGKSSAKIGIAGGSYQSGSTTVTLRKGKSVTLMNTADGTRYTLRLVSTA